MYILLFFDSLLVLKVHKLEHEVSSISVNFVALISTIPIVSSTSRDYSPTEHNRLGRTS
jgi:hypothetical protein